MTELTVLARIRTALSPPSPAIRWTVLGQAIAAIGILVQWAAEPKLFGGFPPGVVYIAAAAGIVLLDRRSPWAPASAIFLAAFIGLGGWAAGDMGRNLATGNTGLIVGVWILNVGLAVSVIAGIVAIAINRRTAPEPQIKPYDRANPRRVAILVTAGGMFLAAVSDAAPEGLHWDGPGPVMFLLLGLLVLFVPGRHMIMLGTLLSAVFVYGAVANQESLTHLTTPSDTVPFVFAILQLVGYSVATAAGALACLPVRSVTPRPAATH